MTMFAARAACPTCLAIRFEQMTVELAHCAGVAIGVALAGEHHDPIEARRDVEQNFCREHADLIFGAARTIADQLRGKQPVGFRHKGG